MVVLVEQTRTEFFVRDCFTVREKESGERIRTNTKVKQKIWSLDGMDWFESSGVGRLRNL